MTEPFDLKSFNKFYTDYHPRFIRFANTYVRDISIAEDITTEAFMTCWENRANMEPGSNVRAYVLTIIKNKCLNHLQHKRIQIKTLDNIQDIAHWELNVRITTLSACDPEEVFSVEIENIINQTLAALPGRTLEVFKMSRYENKTHKEIADALHITTKGVEFHITKALTQLRSGLKDYMSVFLAFFSI